MKKSSALNSSFEVLKCRTLTDADSNGKIIQEAVVKIKKEGEEIHTAVESDLAIRSLYEAFKKALEAFYPDISDAYLVEYIESYSSNKVRITIVSSDSTRDRWAITSSSPNDIVARIKAVTSSLERKIENVQNKTCNKKV